MPCLNKLTNYHRLDTKIQKVKLKLTDGLHKYRLKYWSGLIHEKTGTILYPHKLSPKTSPGFTWILDTGNTHLKVAKLLCNCQQASRPIQQECIYVGLRGTCLSPTKSEVSLNKTQHICATRKLWSNAFLHGKLLENYPQSSH